MDIKEMIHTYSTRIKIQTGSIKTLVALLLLILLAQVMGDNQIRRPPTSKSGPLSEAHKRRIAGQIASDYGLGPFQPSLEMKECADFLLTPAILVQEALSDDIVMTYPTE